MPYDSHTDVQITAKLIDRIFQRVFFYAEPDFAGEFLDPDGLADDDFHFEDNPESEVDDHDCSFQPAGAVMRRLVDRLKP